MGMYINSATGTLGITRNLYQTSVMNVNTMKRLSSGIRINSASDDAAGLSLSQKLTSVINGTNVAKNNTQTGIAMLNTADGALSVMTNSLERIRNLAVQAANGVYTASERQMLQKEVSQLSGDIMQSYQGANFSGKNVFGAQQDVTVGTTQTDQISEAQAVAMGYTEDRIIRTAAEFKSKITGNESKSFILVNDLDLSELGTQMTSVIGTFTGTLDGNGHSANNLSIVRPDASAGWGVGLFSGLNGGTIKNLNVNNASIEGKGYSGVGILVGSTNSSSANNIINCHASGTVTSNSNYLGGLVGFLQGGNVSNSSANINVTNLAAVGPTGGLIGGASGNSIISSCYSEGTLNGYNGSGGLVGFLNSATVKNSTTSVNVTGSFIVGGFVGNCNAGTIQNCSASGNVTAISDSVGGFAGRITSATVESCYATGSLSATAGTNNWGGFVGDVLASGTVKNCYSTGTVNGKNNVGGFVGNNLGSITNSYTTSTVNGTTNLKGFAGSGNTSTSNFYKNNMTSDAGLSADGNTTSIPVANWDASVWDTSSGVPALKNAARAYGTSTNLLGLQIGAENSVTSKIDLNIAFGLGDINFTVSNQNSAKDVLTQVDQLMSYLNTIRSNVGSSINKLSSVISIQDNRVTNLSASNSTIKDADMAQESAQLLKDQIRSQSGAAMLSSVQNLDKNLLMQLIG